MPTILKKLPYVNAASAGIAPVTVSDLERRLFEHPSIKNWWRADAGFDANNLRWLCRKTDAALVPTKGTFFPTRAASAAYNNLPALTFLSGAGTNGALYDGGANLLPINSSFSVVCYGRQGPSDTGRLWGNGLIAPETGAISVMLGVGTDLGGTILAASNVNVLNSGSSTGHINSVGPRLISASWSDDENTARLRSMTNASAPVSYYIATTSATATQNATNGEFHLGDNGPIGTTQSVNNYLENGDVSDVFIFDVALHLSSNTTLDLLVSQYLEARYSVDLTP